MSSPRLPSSSALRAVFRQAAEHTQAAFVGIVSIGPEPEVLRSVGAAPGAEALASIAEALRDTDPLVVSGPLLGLATPLVAAAGVGEGCALVVLVEEGAFSDSARRAFEDARAIVAGLLPDEDVRVELGHARLLQRLASDPAPLDRRLQLALEEGCALLGMDAAILLRYEENAWHVDTVHGADGRIDVDALLAPQGIAQMTYRADSPVGVHAGGAMGVSGAYLGAPVLAGGQGMGVFAFVSSEPRSEPFSSDERALADALARWAGAALNGRRASRRLADREKTLASVYDSAPMPLGLVDLVSDGGADDLVLISSNPHADVVFGAAGRPLSEALPSRALRLWTGAARRVLAEGAASRFEIEVDAESGHPRRLAVALGLVSPASEGRRARFSFVAEDVTARRQMRERLREREAQLRAVVEHAPLVLFAVDDRGTFTLSEGRGLAALGLRPGELVGTSMFERYAHLPEVTQGIGRVLAGQPAEWAATMGRRRFEVHAAPVFDGAGQRAGAVGVARDVTARARAEAEAVRARRAVADVSRRTGDLLARLSHGLRVPLTTVLGYADLLTADTGDAAPVDVDAVEAIARAGHELMRTLDVFIDLSRLGLSDIGGAARAVSAPELATALDAEARAASEALGGRTVEVAPSLAGGPWLLDLGLARTLVRRFAQAAGERAEAAALAIEATHGDDALVLRVASAPERLASWIQSDDALDAAFVRHAVQSLGGEVAVEGSELGGAAPDVVLRVPCHPAPVVELGPLGDGAASEPLLADGP